MAGGAVSQSYQSIVFVDGPYGDDVSYPEMIYPVHFGLVWLLQVTGKGFGFEP